MNDPHDRAVGRFRLRLGTLLALKYALAGLTAWAFVWGTAVLVLRAAAGTPRELLLWGAAGIPLALVPAVVLTRRRLPSRPAVRALLDNHNALGGLLMAGAERQLGRWEEQVCEPALPRLRWRAGRGGAVFAAAAAFLLAGFLVPERFSRAGGPALDVRREVARLAKQVEVLREEKLLEPARADELRKRLDQVRDEAAGKEPARTLEALDRVGDTAGQKGKEAAEAILRKAEQLGQAEALAEVLRRKAPGGGGLGEKANKQAMEQLAALTRKAALENAKLGEIDEKLLDELKEHGLSPEQLEKLAKALGDAKGDLARVLKKLEQVRLIDADKLKECEACGKCDGDGLAAFLKANEGKASVGDLMAQFRLQQPGRGGQDRGPAPAPLTFGKPTEGAEPFKEQALPPGARADLEKSRKLGVSPSAPKVDADGPVASGALAGAAAGGGSANTPVVLPRHRGTVERYFDRPDRPKK